MGNHRPASSATRICWAGSPAARPSTCACRWPTSGRSRSRTAARRKGAVPFRHLPDRLYGRGERQIEEGRHGGGVGLRARRTVRHPSGLMMGAGRVIAIDECRSGCHGRGTAAPRRSTSTRRRLRPADGDDERPRPGPLHRRGRLRGARPRGRSTPCSTRSRWRCSWAPTGCTFCARRSCAAARAARSPCPACTSARDKVPFGAAMNKGLTMKTGQTT